MNWRYTIRGTHVHVRVFMNGANCGNLCFRIEEFEKIRTEAVNINFIDDDDL